MFNVRHKLGPGAYGVGVLADQYIPKGTLVYSSNDFFTQVIPKEVIQRMPEGAAHALLKYVYDGVGEDKLKNAVYYNNDDSRFFNHADTPNLTLTEDLEYVAACNITEGAELFINYYEVCTPGKYCFQFRRK